MGTEYLSGWPEIGTLEQEHPRRKGKKRKGEVRKMQETRHVEKYLLTEWKVR